MTSAQPLEVHVPALPFDVAFHPSPSSTILCCALISGSIVLDRLPQPDHQVQTPSHGAPTAEPEQQVARCWRKKGHKQACRAVSFMDHGQALLSGSSDKSLVLRDTETGTRMWANAHAHDAAVNRLAALGEATVASGDDNGQIKVWDVRQPSCCAAMSVHDDFIADMHHVESRERLLAVSGDGTLSVFDLRKYKKEARSEYAEDELLSVTVVKGGRKVVCGSQEGTLLLYSWGHFNDCSDRFPGHPQSIDALVKLNEDTVSTGSQDGCIRVVSVLPNSFLGVVGQHMDCPIERLALSATGCSLASASHDNTVRVWSLANLRLHESEEEGRKRQTGAQPSGAEEEGDQGPRRRKAKKHKRGKGSASKPTFFFADL